MSTVEKALRSRIAALEEENEALLQRLGEVEPSRFEFAYDHSLGRALGCYSWSLPTMIASLLLASPGVVSRSQIIAAYESANGRECTHDSIDVRMCELRRRLPVGVSIKTVHGAGWFMDAASKAALRKAIEAERAEAAS